MLLTAALGASKEYYNLLSDLEAAHIRGDASSIAFTLQDQGTQSVVRRDNSITVLRLHQRTHCPARARA